VTPKFTFAVDDTTSSFKGSNATQGGSLATRVCLIITKIITSLHQLSASDEDVAELNSLITEVNQIDTLSLKHSTINKILALLTEKQSSEMTLTEKVNESKQLQFKSKLRLASKTLQVNPMCIELVSAALNKLQKMVDSRASEIEDAMDEQAELKFKATLDVKKKLNLKIAFA
jgi:hypothetical protein